MNQKPKRKSKSHLCGSVLDTAVSIKHDEKELNMANDQFSHNVTMLEKQISFGYNKSKQDFAPRNLTKYGVKANVNEYKTF